jgi:hypothetical protein
MTLHHRITEAMARDRIDRHRADARRRETARRGSTEAATALRWRVPSRRRV